MKNDKILLGHGSGGSMSRRLIVGLLLKQLDNPVLHELADSAVIDYSAGTARRAVSANKLQLAFTTDSFVVSPLEFPGGDIGKLAVCGTVNDLVMQAAVPEFLSLAFIIEEGTSYALLSKIVRTIAITAKAAGVRIATGDLKVVERGACDKIFINTSGIGRVLDQRRLSLKNIRPGDKIIVTGSIGRHSLAVLARRNELSGQFSIKSDCAALNGFLIPVLQKTGAVRFMRDPTRGGIAAVLNEIAEGSGLGMLIEEKDIPVQDDVKAACELLGIDVLSAANEGVAVMVVAASGAERTLGLLRGHRLGKKARIVGSIQGKKSRVVLNTVVGTQRVIELPAGELMPRIC